MRHTRPPAFHRLAERTLPPPFSERFFLIVQKAEYAMKRAGYLVSPQNAMASWKKLGTSIDTVSGGDLLDVVRADRRCRVLFDHPPSKLGVHNNMLVWHEQRPPTNPSELMEIARDIRNSLFHGEKSPHRPRDEELVAAAMRVLEIVINAAERLRDRDPSLALFVDALFEDPADLPFVPLPPSPRQERRGRHAGAD